MKVITAAVDHGKKERRDVSLTLLLCWKSTAVKETSGHQVPIVSLIYSND